MPNLYFLETIWQQGTKDTTVDNFDIFDKFSLSSNKLQILLLCSKFSWSNLQMTCVTLLSRLLQKLKITTVVQMENQLNGKTTYDAVVVGL